MMMGGPGVTEILVIAVILVLIFGAKRLPSIGEGLGKTVKELKKAKKEMSKKPVEKTQALEGGSSGNEDTGGGEEEKPKSEEDNSEEDLADALQKKVTKKVTDTVMSQVPGVKQAKQFKDKADKIKKLVS
jgi:sec-independent protein translocase protein TatA